jgi:hypothetical protein
VSTGAIGVGAGVIFGISISLAFFSNFLRREEKSNDDRIIASPRPKKII